MREAESNSKLEVDKQKLDKFDADLKIKIKELELKKESIEASKLNSYRNSLDKNLNN